RRLALSRRNVLPRSGEVRRAHPRPAVAALTTLLKRHRCRRRIDRGRASAGSSKRGGGEMPNHGVSESITGSQTRRTFLKRAGGGAISVLGGTLWRTGAAAAARLPKSPITNVIIACQENRSFD